MIITLFIIGIVLAVVAYYFDYHHWFSYSSSVTGKSINPLYFILAIACLVAGRIISYDVGSPIGLIFYLAGAVFLIIAVYGIITKIK